VGTWDSFLRGKAVRPWIWPPPSSAEVKNGGAITPFPHMSLWHDIYLTEDRDNFTFFFSSSLLPFGSLLHFLEHRADFSVSWPQMVGLLGWVISSSQGLYLNTEKHAHTHQISMPWVGFKPTIPASKRAKTVHALDRSATVTGNFTFKRINFKEGIPPPLFVLILQIIDILIIKFSWGTVIPETDQPNGTAFCEMLLVTWLRNVLFLWAAKFRYHSHKFHPGNMCWSTLIRYNFPS
jgi:hypothetical protein